MNKKDKIKLLIYMAICVGVIGFYIYLLIKYGNRPVSEIPTWVFFLLRGNK